MDSMNQITAGNPELNREYNEQRTGMDEEPHENRLKMGRLLLGPTAALALIAGLLECDTYSFLGISHCGVTTLIITAITEIYYLVIMKLMKKKIKLSGIMYLLALSLLGIATFLSDDAFMAVINKYAIIVLTVSLMINGLADDSKFGFIKHIASWFSVIGGALAILDWPIKDMIVMKLEAPEDVRKSNVKRVLAGILISIPLLIVILSLLCSADAVFKDLLNDLLPNISLGKTISLCFITTLVYLGVYSAVRFILSRRFNTGDILPKQHSAIVAITVGIIISIVYGAFSIVQLVYLFGKHTLPQGYTYASYAKEGVFQLMWLSILNLVIVFAGITFFEKNKFLKALLTFISACTYMMVASSSYRLWQYVNICHGLTRKRLWGIWGLVTVSVCFAGLLIYIYRAGFNLHRFGLVTIVSTYLVLALLKPDYIVAKTNLELLPAVISSECDTDLLNRLGLDALPAMEKYDPEWIFRRGFYEFDSSFAGTDESEGRWKYINLSELRGRQAYMDYLKKQSVSPE